MALAQTIIKNFMNSLDNTNLKGERALDEAARKSSYFSSWQAVKNAMYNDLRSYGWNYKAFLKEKCGIDLSNLETGDTGAITGYDAGNGTVKTKESIVPENPNAELRRPLGGNLYYNGLTINWPSYLKNTSDISLKRLSTYLHTYYIPNGLNLIYESYGLSFNEKGTTVKNMSFEYKNVDKTWRAQVYNEGYNGNTTSLVLRVNRKYYPDINSIDGHSTNAKESCYLDRVIAHELTHAVMAANIRYFKDLPHYFKEGAAELVHGADDDRYHEIVDLAQNPSKLYAVITNSSIDNPDNTNNGYAGGYMLLRYFAKQAAEQINYARTTTTLKVNSAGTYSLADKTTQSRYPNATTLDATDSTGAVILIGNGRNNVLKAGKGSSSLWGGAASSDTLQGGSGRDMFWFGKNDGNDVINDFHAGRDSNSDVVNLYTNGLTAMSRSGKDVQFKMGQSTVTVHTDGAADSVVQFSFDGKNISGAKIGETNAANRLTYDANVKAFQGGNRQDTLAVSGSANHSVFLNNVTGQVYAGIEIIDASSSTGKDSLAGDKQANTIYGGSGETAMWGGPGSANDILVGGNGTTTFLYGYGEGSDVIRNTSNDDKVFLYNAPLNKFSNAAIYSNQVVLTTKLGQTLTVNGNAGTFTFADGSSWKPNYETRQWKRLS